MKLIKEIKEIGVQKVIEKYALIVRYADDKVLLKYNQIDSWPYKYEIPCMEARGIILERDTWKVYSFGFRRFFNLGEVEQPNFNWNNYSMFKKADGTLINLYWDWYNNKWQVATTGVIYADSDVQDHKITFAELFWRNCDIDLNKLNKDYVYNFELCTPYNQVVVYHKESHVTLLSIKDRTKIDDGKYGELHRRNVEKWADRLGVKVIKEYKHKTESQILTFVNNKDGIGFEGVVLVDKHFNRIKVKNEKYVRLHHNVSTFTDTSLYNLIMQGEEDEAIAYFPHVRKRLIKISDGLNWFKKFCLITILYYQKLLHLDKKDFYASFNQHKKHMPIVAGIVEKIIYEDDYSIFDDYLKNLDKNKIKKLIKHIDKMKANI